MIKYDPHSWIKLLTHSYSREIYKQLWPAMTVLAIYTLGLTWAIEYFKIDLYHTMAIHSLLGIVLGLFLVFRTNGAYDRWWEGRKLWGALVNTCRNFALKMHNALPENKEDKELFWKLYSNFVFAMKEHLRDGVKMEEMEEIDERFRQGMEKRVHKPNYIVDRIYERLNELYKKGEITGHQLFIIDAEIRELLDILGGCERIKNTPIPYSYNMFLKKFIFLFTVTVPLAIVSIFHYWTVVVVLFLFYILASTELIAEEIEDPFGTDANDLPTDNLSAKIKDNIKEILLDERR